MQPSLTKRVRSGLAWNGASTLASYAVSVGRSVVLARLLTPGDFGLWGMALTIPAALSALTNMGTDISVIVRRFPGGAGLAEHLNAVWTAELIRRAALTLLISAAAYPAARFYGEPRLRVILPLMSLTPLIQGLQNIGLVVYRKRLSFKRVVWFEQLTNLASAALAVALACRTRDVWALVLSQLLATAFGVLLSYAFHPHRPRFEFDAAAFRRVFDFGKYVFLIGVAAYVTTTADNVLVGKLLGAGVLGVYVVAYGLATLPVSLVGTTLSDVMLPAYAELGARGAERLGRAFARVLMNSSVLLTVMTVPLMLFGDEVVLLLYGTRWAAAGAVLRVLAWVGLLRGLVQALTPLLYNLEGPRLEAEAKLAEAIIFLPALAYLTPNWGMKGAACAGVAAYLVGVLIRFRLVKALAPRAFERVPSILSKNFLAGACGAASGALVLLVTEDVTARVLAGGAAAVAVAVASALWLQPDLRGEIVGLLSPARPEA